MYPSTLIIRHRKENLKKCSLRGLETKPFLDFLRYPVEKLPSLKGSILLSMDAPILSKQDCGKPLLLIDATWRYAETIEKVHREDFAKCTLRSLPQNFRTAYPRRQEDCSDPMRGLASVEALYIAHRILGYPLDQLLDHYYWKEEFLHQNQKIWEDLIVDT